MSLSNSSFFSNIKNHDLLENYVISVMNLRYIVSFFIFKWA